MEACAEPSDTTPSATALLASLASTVRWMWMSVPADLATMEPPVWTILRAIHVSVQRVSLVFSVRMRSLTVWRMPALKEPCAKTCLDQTTLNVCAGMDSREKTVTSPLTLALRMETPVPMRLAAEPYLRVDTLASVLMAGRELIVNRTSMIVWNSLAYWEPTVLTWSMTSAVTVPEASLARGVRPRWTCVTQTPVSEASVWTSCSGMSVSVSLAGLVLTVTSTLMTVATLPVRMMASVLMTTMATLVSVSLASLARTVNTQWTIVLMNPARMEAPARVKEMALSASVDLVSLAVPLVR